MDYRQIRALTLYTLKSEWRQASVKRMGGRRKMSSRWFYVQVLLYLLAGLFMIRLFIEIPTAQDFVLGVSLLSIYLGVLTASNIFLSFSAGFLSPDEAIIVSPLPVSSSTFFFSRLTVLLIYSSTIAMLIALPASIWVIFGTDAGVMAGMAIAVASALSSIAAALSVIVLYGLVLRGLSRAVLSKAIGYLQLVSSFIIAGTYAILPQIRGNLHLAEFGTKYASIFEWLPPYWFGNLAAVLWGDINSSTLILSGAAVLMLAGVSAGAHILLGKHYQAEVVELAQSSQEHTKQTVARYGPLFKLYLLFARSHEARAVFMLVRAQFRFDSKYRNAILGILPIIIIYMVLAILQGGIRDPFGGRMHANAVGSSMLYFFAMYMPVMLMQNIMMTENYKAAWIFFALPEDRAKLLFAIRNTIILSIVLPFMLALAAIFSYYMPLGHALKHVLIIISIGSFVVQTTLLFQSRMPFAHPRRPNQRGVTQIMSGVFMALIPMGLLVLELSYGYSSTLRYWMSFAVIITLAAIMEIFVRSRVRVKLEREEFEG